MSSHYEWVKKVIAEHNENKPFAPENGNPLKFKIDDKVKYTNCSGMSFELTVTGYYKPEFMNSLYAEGFRYMLDWPCNWMPVKESSLEFLK